MFIENRIKKQINENTKNRKNFMKERNSGKKTKIEINLVFPEKV